VNYSDAEDSDEDNGPLDNGPLVMAAVVFVKTEVSPRVKTTPPERTSSGGSPARSMSTSSPHRGTNVKSLEEKCKRYFEFKAKGKNVITALKNNKQFRNPTIYSKLVQFCNINETGTNYPIELFNPAAYPKSSHYDTLAAEQDKALKAYEKKRKERTTVEFAKEKKARSHES